jgi:hypothetical protein
MFLCDACGFALLGHIISQMMVDAGICEKFKYAVTRVDNVNYYETPLDKYIDCDFSEFMASTASKYAQLNKFVLFVCCYVFVTHIYFSFYLCQDWHLKTPN